MSARRSGSALKLTHAAPIFSALGDETRLHLLARLSEEGPLSITRLSERSVVTRQAITKHLNVLSEAGLVTDRHTGRERVFRLELARVQDARKALEQISAQWDVALGRLKSLLEDDGSGGE